MGFDLEADALDDDTPPRIYTMADHTPIPPGPCPGCWRAPQCRIYELACAGFHDFVELGKYAANASRDASHWRFQRIFKSDPDADAQALAVSLASLNSGTPASAYTQQRLAEIGAEHAA